MLELHRDYRLGNTIRYVLLEEGEELMRVPDEIRKCCAFIYYQSYEGTKLAGTGFFVGVRVLELEKGGYDAGYFVTAKHVIDEINKNAISSNIGIRLNSKTEGTIEVEAPIDKWAFHPNDTNVDVAVLPYATPPTKDDFISIPTWDMAVTNVIIEKEKIGVGDEVFLTGLFRSHFGRKKNLPIIRIGNIAMMPEEPIETRDFGLMIAYLIEARSIGGISGSPVFVYTGGMRQGTLSPARYYWLGLMHGHWDIDEEKADLYDEYYQQQINVGIGIVVPTDKIMEVIPKIIINTR